MSRVRRWAWASLLLAFGQVVFGAIVRITGSGMGCGDHWPLCQGQFFPPLNRFDLLIEVTHRYIAAALSTAIVVFAGFAWVHRRTPMVGGRLGVLRPAVAALVLVLTAALFGAVVVKLDLANKLVIVTHLAIAMSLLAVLCVAVVRVGGPPRVLIYRPAASVASSSQRTTYQIIAPGWSPVSIATARGAVAAAGLIFLALVLGALTANVPGANIACTGFPLCSGSLWPTDPSQYLQFAHRLLAYALLLYVVMLARRAQQRRESDAVWWARATAAAVALQVVVAAGMVTLHLPATWRSLHEAVGTLAWIVSIFFAYAAHLATQRGPSPEAAGTAVQVAA